MLTVFGIFSHVSNQISRFEVVDGPETYVLSIFVIEPAGIRPQIALDRQFWRPGMGIIARESKKGERVIGWIVSINAQIIAGPISSMHKLITDHISAILRPNAVGLSPVCSRFAVRSIESNAFALPFSNIGA